jgi:hypothetical protein
MAEARLPVPMKTSLAMGVERLDEDVATLGNFAALSVTCERELA